MSIQISVTIWTVICFILLMIILNNLLFKPMLSMMDKRRERITAARAKKEEYEKAALENERLLAEKAAENASHRQQLIKQRVEKVGSDRKKAIEDAKEARLKRLDETRRSTDAEEIEILTQLGTHAEELAVMLAERIVKG